MGEAADPRAVLCFVVFTQTSKKAWLLNPLFLSLWYLETMETSKLIPQWRWTRSSSNRHMELNSMKKKDEKKYIIKHLAE